MDKILKISRILIAIISIAILILGFLINPDRKISTGKILGFQEFLWTPFLYAEHFLGEFFLANFFFVLIYIALTIGDLISKFISYLFSKKFKIPLNIIEFSKYSSIVIAFLFPVYYEVIHQNGQSYLQLLFDIMGFLLFVYYINKAFPTRRFKELIKSL